MQDGWRDGVFAERALCAKLRRAAPGRDADDSAGALDLAAATTGLGSVALVPGAAAQ